METINRRDALRSIPPVNEILDYPEMLILSDRLGRERTLDIIRKVIGEYREKITADDLLPEELKLFSRKEVINHLVKKLIEMADERGKTGLKKVINATGIVLHTNLGRAPLPQKAIKAMEDISEGYSNLEYDLEKGTRGSRHSHIEEFIKRITGAESAIIVNNNAAAVFLCLNTLAADKEVIVSRGQQVEIGGSFRIPDIISRSGCRMVEVGTTNKTRFMDYSAAINENTAVLLKVHTSNYIVTGFTEEVALQELVKLGRESNVVVMEDLGSGSLYDLSNIISSHEPLVQDSIKAGADLVTFSGDKLLGGPQAGIIAGKKELIERINKNPLARMVRCDKSTIAALAGVLSLYMEMDTVVENVPVLKMLAMKEEELLERALELKNNISDSIKDKCVTEVVDDSDEVGGGSLPGIVLRGKAVAVTALNMSSNELQSRLRKGRYPIVGRINKERLLLNVRTLDKRDYPVIAESLKELMG